MIILLLGVTSLALSIVGNDAQLSPNQGNTVGVVDYETWKDDSIVELLCQQSSSSAPGSRLREISRVSTVEWFFEHFRSLPWDEIPAQAPISQCFSMYAEPLEHLRTIVAVGKDDACSHEKIDLIEEFHRKYIIGNIFRTTTRAEDTTSGIPEPLRLFFVRYSVEVAEACKWSLMRNLNLARQHVDTSAIFESDGFGQLIDLMQNYFGAPKVIQDFDDFVHIWDMVDDYGRRIGDLPQELARDHQTGERPGFNILVNSAGGLLALQAECRNTLRPIYGPLVLPVMRLASLGYHVRRGPASPMASDGYAQDWYLIGQACEALLPVGLFESEHMAPGKVEMITADEVARFGDSRLAQMGRPLEFYFEPSVLSGIDTIDSVFQLDPRDLIGQIQYNIKLRRQYFKSLVKQLSSLFKDKLKSKLADFSLSKKAAQARHVDFQPAAMLAQGEETFGADQPPPVDQFEEVWPTFSGDFLDDFYMDEDEMGAYGDQFMPLQRMKRGLFTSSRRRRKKMERENQVDFPAPKRSLRQKIKRVTIIMILIGVISALVFTLLWFARG